MGYLMVLGMGQLLPKSDYNPGAIQTLESKEAKDTTVEQIVFTEEAAESDTEELRFTESNMSKEAGQMRLKSLESYNPIE